MKTTAKKEKLRKVNFSLLAPQAESVSIAGDFNHWDIGSHSMKKDKKGVWKISLNLASGIYQYNFYVDGAWQNDSRCTEYVENPFGSLNCVKRVE
jgi:1,4-alpha-glucan branching enzyme